MPKIEKDYFLLPLYNNNDDGRAALIEKRPSISAYYTFGRLPVVLADDDLFYGRRQAFLRLSMGPATIFCCSAPVVALFCCVVISIWANFDEVTETHCNVANALPSISAAIGDFEPQRSIWRLFIFAHLPLRFLAAFAYADFFRESIMRSSRRSSALHPLLINVSSVFNFTELLSLAFVSAVTSDYSHNWHKRGFTLFEIAGFLFMVVHMYLYRIAGKTASIAGARSYGVKRRCFFALIALMFICGYFYYRHNVYCEPYMFTMFAVFEYALVVTNISFHATVYLDFRGKSFYIG